MSAAGPTGSLRDRLVLALRNERLRLIAGVVLLAVGALMIGTLLVGQAQKPDGQYGIDYGDYRQASLRMLDGRSPYAPEMLVGPVPAQGVDRYRYPPPFALIVAPISVLPATVAATVWLFVQLGCIMAALLLAVRSTGRSVGLRHVVWCGVAMCYFFPVFADLWQGNVDGPLALLAALAFTGGAAARTGRASGRVLAGSRSDAMLGAASGAAAWLKVSPAVWLAPATWNRHALTGLAAVSALLVVPCVLIAPQAWLDYAKVLPNMLAGSADYATNLAPGQLVARIGGVPAVVATAARWAVAASAIALVLGAMLLEWRGSDRRLVVLLGVSASLLLPAAFWYHYLVVLLPFGVAAWLETDDTAVRSGLIVGSVCIGLALGIGLALATLGGVVFAASAAVGLRRAGASSSGVAASAPESPHGPAATDRAPAGSTVVPARP
jgi:hypothetical protein